MEQKQRFFIYDRKEMGVLLLLGVMVAIFAFTLGVHLGKRVGPKGAAAPHSQAETVATEPDHTPNRQELTEQAKGAQPAADEALNQALHEEVAKTGIKMDNPRQVDLPKDAKSEAAPAHGSGHSEPAHSDAHATAPQGHASSHGEATSDLAASKRAAPAGKFTLQIGSYPVASDARDQADSLEALGLKPFLRPADVKGKRWYRLYVGGFDSKDAAEKTGQRYVSQHMIEAFVVSKMVER